MKMPLVAALLAAAAAIPSAAAQAQQTLPRYRATLLHPPGYASSTADALSGDTIVGAVELPGTPLAYHAALWDGTAGSVLDLHPEGYQWSGASAASGALQGGYGGNPIPNDPFGRFLDHALLWHGTAESVVNLHPAGFVESRLAGMAGQQQVGYGETDAGMQQALLWTGSADSVVSLHPAGFRSSLAAATSGTTQVGRGEPPSGSVRALLWNGTAESVVDLHPAGWDGSLAYGAWGPTQVGVALAIPDPSGFSNDHAMLWTGSAASAVDLHPARNFISSYALSAAGNFQAGAGFHGTTRRNHALLWRGSAASVVDLQLFVVTQLGARYVESHASAVDENGNVVGFVFDANFRTYAVKWSLIPEPASWSLLACGLAGVRGSVVRRRG